jgi:hypothetical protein
MRIPVNVASDNDGKTATHCRRQSRQPFRSEFATWATGCKMPERSLEIAMPNGHSSAEAVGGALNKSGLLCAGHQPLTRNFDV